MTDKWMRIAIVTGATSGIGEGVARKFVAHGFGVVGNGRNSTKLSSLEEELGPAFFGVAGDAADGDVLDRLFAASSERFGADADIVVVNAGRGLAGGVSDADMAQFEKVLNINVKGAATLMQKASRKMVEMQKGRYPATAADIVVIGSVVGRNISPFSAVYGATKFAVRGLAEGLRREVGPHGVRVSLVEPGVVLSGFQAAAGYPDDMAEVFKEKYGSLLLAGDDIADAVYHVVSQPPHVHISNITVRPTRMDYP